MLNADEICETFSKVGISNEMTFYKETLKYGHGQYSQYSYYGHELKVKSKVMKVCSNQDNCWGLLFSKAALNVSKVTVKAFYIFGQKSILHN